MQYFNRHISIYLFCVQWIIYTWDGILNNSGMTIEGFIGIYQPLTGIYSELSYLCMTYLGGILGFVQYIYMFHNRGQGTQTINPCFLGIYMPIMFGLFWIPIIYLMYDQVTYKQSHDHGMYEKMNLWFAFTNRYLQPNLTNQCVALAHQNADEVICDFLWPLEVRRDCASHREMQASRMKPTSDRSKEGFILWPIFLKQRIRRTPCI
jgi:hypothetical protein